MTPRPALPFETLHFETPTDAARPRSDRWHRRRHPWLLALRARYIATSRRTQMVVDLCLHIALPFVLGLVLYIPLALIAPGLLSAWYVVLVISLLATALVIAMECAQAMVMPQPPIDDLPTEQLPRLGIIVAAHLANEAETIMESLQHHLTLDYPANKLIVVLAYNSAETLPIETDLNRLATEDPRFVALRVAGSTSKAENINAALDYLAEGVDVVGLFDADHHPHPTVARRAARWLSDAAGQKRVDVVQGQCVIRNADETFVSRTVAAEFATIYAVSHPGRTALHGFGIFGGSNGFWRSEVLDALGMDTYMLTEDIDVTSRALLEGRRIATDPGIVSTELAPETWTALWRQRMRWSQGWWEVTQRHTRALLESDNLTGQQKRGVAVLYVWRVLHPWLATQMWPLIATLLVFGSRKHMAWGVPIFVLTSIVTLGMPVLQAALARRLSPPGLRENRRLFVRYGVVSILFYAEFRAIVNRAAVVRDFVGVHIWNVTPRGRHHSVTTAPIAATDEPLAAAS